MDPAPPTDLDYHPKLAEISPSFAEIIEQAEKAAQQDLDRLVGIGYRKALEFLIKDWLKHKLPQDKHEAIEKTALNGCIHNFVTEPRIKEVASRAVWLGNDETHYIREWTAKDISDLKLLMQLTLYWIRMDIVTDEAIASMPKPEKPEKPPKAPPA